MTLAASAPSSSRLPTLTRWVKSPEAISSSLASISRIGPISDSEIVRPRISARGDGADDKGDDDRLRGAIGLAARLDARHHIRLGLVDQLVGQPLEPVRQRPRLLQLRLARLVDMPAADQLDDPGHDGDEAVVFLPDLAEQLDLVLGDELQPLEVVAELVQLAQRTVQGALVRDQAVPK